MYFHIAGGVFQGKFLESGKLDQSECTVIFVTHYQIPCIRVLPFAFSAEIHKSDFLLSLAHGMYCHILNFCQSVRNCISFLVCVSLFVSEVELDFVEEPFLHLFRQPVYLLLLIFYQIFGPFFLAYKSSLCFKDISSLLLIYISKIFVKFETQYEC